MGEVTDILFKIKTPTLEHWFSGYESQRAHLRESVLATFHKMPATGATQLFEGDMKIGEK